MMHRLAQQNAAAMMMKTKTPSNIVLLRGLAKGKAPAVNGSAAKGGAAPSSVAPAHVPLPVQLYGLHARYANALYVAATRAGSLAGVEADLSAIQGLLKSTPAFGKYLSNPIIRKDDKLVDIEKISKGMNETTRGFLAVLASNGRLADLEKVMATFGILMNARSGTVEAIVTTAEPLTGDALKKIEKNILSTYLEKGQSLKLTSAVDPSILGGLQVRIGERFIDLSVSSKISKYEKLLSAAV